SHIYPKIMHRDFGLSLIKPPLQAKRNIEGGRSAGRGPALPVLPACSPSEKEPLFVGLKRKSLLLLSHPSRPERAVMPI
ncbi:MAG: hypothetical protein ACI3YD_06220, partial [Alloprevotella sp.]